MGVLLCTSAGCANAAPFTLKLFLETIHFGFHLPKHVIVAQHVLLMQPAEVPTLFGC